MSDHSELKRLAEAATPQGFDSAAVKVENGYIECPHCEGEGQVELEADYCNYDGAAIGVQFYGIGLEFGAAEAYFRAANPAAVLALIAEVEGLRAQHGRDSAELRSLCQARDDARKERDSLKAEVKALRSKAKEFYSQCEKYGDAIRSVVSERGALKAEVEELRKEVASLKPSPIQIGRTTIGYTGCVICGQYTDHGGLQCPNLAARSLSMENQRIVPVEPIRSIHPLDAAMGKGEKA